MLESNLIVVAVHADAESLATARALSRARRSAEVERVLSHLGRAHSWSEETIEALQDQREASIARLSDAARGSGGQPLAARVGALLLLLRLGESAAASELARLLREGDVATRLATLAALRDESCALQDVTPALQEALLARLVDADEAVRSSAVWTCAALRIPGVWERAVRLLGSLRALEEGFCCSWLARHSPSREALDHTARLLLDSSRRDVSHDVREAMTRYALGSDPCLREHAGQILLDYERQATLDGASRAWARELIARCGLPQDAARLWDWFWFSPSARLPRAV